ncbi:MAG: hypothetical protein WA843_02855 [Candidatus Saccharimonadales bacterium]
MLSLQTKILRILRSPQFFVAILVLFVLEASWIAISAAYPMVFDENTHLGIIQLYAHRWSPLFFQQPPHSGWAGALTRDPSYLYHYLMSFPYRLIAAMSDSQMVQVVFLRLINVALFASGLVLFRRLLLRTRVSPAITHVALLFFILTPVVPLLAGQINYDNLVMPLVALALLVTISVSDSITRDKKLPLARCAWLLTLCLLGSLVQYVFLPIFAGVVLWIGWLVIRSARSGQIKLSVAVSKDWRTTSWRHKLAVGLPLIIALALFTQMYGVNIVRYHNPLPVCGQVLSKTECAQYAPWERSQQALANKTSTSTNPLAYGISWTYRMFIALFFTSSGGASPSAFYLSVNPLPIVFGAALSVFGVGILLFIKYHRTVLRRYDYLGFLLFISLFYVAALWWRNYHDYVHLGEKVAIQGRYLFPVALPGMILIALAFRELLGQRTRLKIALLSVVLFLFLQGGGALTYIINSNQHWYWQNGAVVQLNETLQHIIKPLIIIKTPLRSFGRF